ncbi:MAG: alpha/beta fold hydrolase [Gammaproteobacteria bacterium AqS3]|nr:alpha/beta fold hydrolase [Gammaproteobacteria bacterium AqS3]
MEILRTPDERFEGIAGFDYTPCYLEVQDEDGTALRVHYTDQGPPDAPPVLLMHGNPTWSYLYRNFIPPLVAAGHRVLTVDLIGCGRSDKPALRADYTQARHYHWMSQWLQQMELRDITLFCQDWGGTIGLYLVSQFPERFARVCAANTGLPDGGGGSEGVQAWIAMMAQMQEFPFEDVFAMAVASRSLTEAEVAAYRAPYPDGRFMHAICGFPALIAVESDNPGVAQNRAAWEALERFDKPFLTIWGAKDPVTAGGQEVLQRRIPGARGQAHAVLPEAGHFLQEDAPEEVVERLLAFIDQG